LLIHKKVVSFCNMLTTINKHVLNSLKYKYVENIQNKNHKTRLRKSFQEFIIMLYLKTESLTDSKHKTSVITMSF
jgi:hypothetical protein